MAALASAAPATCPAPTILQARPAEPSYAPPQLPRHIRRKIEAIRRKRQDK
jgi:hypothetical protein